MISPFVHSLFVLTLVVTVVLSIRPEDDLHLLLEQESAEGLNKFDSSGRSLLVEAAAHGRFAFVEAMIATKTVALDIRDKQKGVTALIASIRAGHHHIAELLLEAGASTNVGDRDATTPVMMACKLGASTLAEQMIKKGADVAVVDNNGYNALMYAAVSGDADIIQMILGLVQHNQGVNMKSKNDGKTALLVAASNAHWEAVQILIKHGVSLDDQANSDGFAAIHFAAGQGTHEVVQSLIEHGAEVNIFSKQYGQSPLYLAVKSSAIKTVQALLKAGADPNHPSSDLNYTPLIAAAVMNNKEMIAALLKGRADPTFTVKHCNHRMDPPRCTEHTALSFITTMGKSHANTANLLRLAEKEWALSHKDTSKAAE